MAEKTENTYVYYQIQCWYPARRGWRAWERNWDIPHEESRSLSGTQGRVDKLRKTWKSARFRIAKKTIAVSTEIVE